MTQDISQHLQNQIQTCTHENKAIQIQGSNSKDFYGNPTNGELINIKPHQGILNYQASELVITARAGTTLKEIESELEKNQQKLPFEPPHFSSNATLGGAIATGLAGPSRPFTGSVRDAVLGCKIINGKGEILHFGGEVVKNVAGYDVSRLMTGAMGTLGLILEVSVKLLPKTPSEKTYVLNVEATDVISTISNLRRSTLPLTAIAFLSGKLYVRVSGIEPSLIAASKTLGNEYLDNSIGFWQSIKEQSHSYFKSDKNLWRIMLPPASTSETLVKNSLIDWAGGLYWYYSDKPGKEIHELANSHNGFATLFRQTDNTTHVSDRFSPLNQDMLQLQKRIKQAFDPKNIFNPGKIYADI